MPPYIRKAKTIEAALPWLYLKGISTGEVGAALKMLLGGHWLFREDDLTPDGTMGGGV